MSELEYNPEVERAYSVKNSHLERVAPTLVLCEAIFAGFLVVLSLCSPIAVSRGTLACVLLPLPIIMFTFWFMGISQKKEFIVNALGPIALFLSSLYLFWTRTTEWVVVNRDPGFYALSFQNWSRHKFPLQVWPDHLPVPKGFQVNSGGFDLIPGKLNLVSTQGGVGFQRTGSLIGKLLGDKTVAHTNALLAAIFILIFFQFLKDRVSLFSAYTTCIVLGVSLPYLYIATSQFSELESMILGWLSFLVISRTSSKLKYLQIISLGVLLFCLSTVRIDAPLCVLLPGLIYLTLSSRPESDDFRDFSLILTGIVGTFAGQRVFGHFSPAYVHALKHEIQVEWGIVVVGLLVSIMYRCSSSRIVNLYNRMLKISVIIFYIFLLLRPLYPSLTRSDQALARFYPGGKTYDEFTIQSFIWYFGPFWLILSTLGIYAIFKNTDESFKKYSLWISILISELFGYFFTWNIAPDQPWASRRLVSFGYPILLAFGALFFDKKIEKFSKVKQKVQRARKRKYKKTQIILGPTEKRVVLSLIILLAIIWPGNFGLKFFTQNRYYAGLNNPLLATCTYINQLPVKNEQKKVLLISNDLYPLIQTFRTYCDLPAAVATDPTVDPILLSSTANKQNNNNYAYIAITSSASGLGKVRIFKAPVSVIHPTLSSSPNSWDLVNYQWVVHSE
jgi:hypothetical protein